MSLSNTLPVVSLRTPFLPLFLLTIIPRLVSSRPAIAIIILCKDILLITIPLSPLWPLQCLQLQRLNPHRLFRTKIGHAQPQVMALLLVTPTTRRALPQLLLINLQSLTLHVFKGNLLRAILKSGRGIWHVPISVVIQGKHLQLLLAGTELPTIIIGLSVPRPLSALEKLTSPPSVIATSVMAQPSGGSPMVNLLARSLAATATPFNVLSELTLAIVASPILSPIPLHICLAALPLNILPIILIPNPAPLPSPSITLVPLTPPPSNLKLRGPILLTLLFII